jgi:pSer/pThr/pTyr-binding forkhead associated (FHA) protein
MISSVTLTVVDGPHKGKVFSCVGSTLVTIGRSEGCTYRLCGQLEDALVSRRHCLIDVRSDRVEIRDLESCNGTYVNGQRLGFAYTGEDPEGPATFKRQLQHGDVIQIGSSVLAVGVHEAPDHARTAAEGSPMDRDG